MSLPSAGAPQASAPPPPHASSSAPTPATPEHKADLAAISVQSRIPEFWIDQPRLWYLQVEAVLAPQHLAEDAKCNLIIAKLPKQVIQQVTDIITNPAATGRYQQLKERLINIYEETETRKVQKLLNEMELGDQRPSQLLRRMKELAHDKIPDETLKILWQGHLPVAVRGVLAVTETADLEVLSRVADKVLENTTPTSGISEVSVPGPSAVPTSQLPTSAVDLIIAEIRKMGQRFNASQRGPAGHSRSQAGSSAAAGTPKKTRDKATWQCFYHFRYKDKAIKCVPPCSWKPEN